MAPAMVRTSAPQVVVLSQSTVLVAGEAMEAATMTVETTGTCDARSMAFQNTLPTMVRVAHTAMVKALVPRVVAHSLSTVLDSGAVGQVARITVDPRGTNVADTTNMSKQHHTMVKVAHFLTTTNPVHRAVVASQ